MLPQEIIRKKRDGRELSGDEIAFVVRGIVDEVGPVALLGNDVALMDISTAQHVLAHEGRVDRIDLHIRADSDAGAVRKTLESTIQGRARVHGVVDEGARVRGLLGSLRVVLALAGALGAVTLVSRLLTRKPREESFLPPPPPPTFQDPEGNHVR